MLQNPWKRISYVLTPPRGVGMEVSIETRTVRCHRHDLRRMFGKSREERLGPLWRERMLGESSQEHHERRLRRERPVQRRHSGRRHQGRLWSRLGGRRKEYSQKCRTARAGGCGTQGVSGDEAAPHLVDRLHRAPVLHIHGTHDGLASALLLPGNAERHDLCPHPLPACPRGRCHKLQILHERLQDAVPRLAEHGFADRTRLGGIHEEPAPSSPS